MKFWPIFQSTPPVKAATAVAVIHINLVYISIHAAREGGDRFPLAVVPRPKDFNPRRP